MVSVWMRRDNEVYLFDTDAAQILKHLVVSSTVPLMIAIPIS